MATLRELVTKLSFKADTKAVKDFERQVDKADDALDGLAKKSGKAEKGLDGVSKKARDAKKPLSDINAGAKNAGMGLSALNLGLAGASLAFVGFATNAVKSFGDLEHVFNTIRAVAPEVTPRMKEIEKSVMELGASTTFSSLEVAKAYEELAKKGFTAQQMLETMPGILDSATASGEELAQVADIVTASINQFNLKTSQSGEVADILTQGANSSSASILQLGEGLKYAGIAGAMNNQTLKDMVATLALATNGGIQAGDAGSDLQMVLTRLNATAIATDGEFLDLRNTFKKLGVSILDNKGQMRPFLTIIEELKVKTANYTDAQRTDLSARLAGINSMKTFNYLLGLSDDKLQAMTTSMGASAGSSKKASDIMKQGLNSTMEKLGGATDAFNVEVGKMFAPATIAGLLLLTETMNGLAKPIMFINSLTSGEIFSDLSNLPNKRLKNIENKRKNQLKQGMTPQQIIDFEAKNNPELIGSSPKAISQYKQKALNDIRLLSKNNPQSIGASSSTTSNKTTNISQTIMVQGGTGTPAQQKQAGQNIANHTRVALQKGGVK